MTLGVASAAATAGAWHECGSKCYDTRWLDGALQMGLARRADAGARSMTADALPSIRNERWCCLLAKNGLVRGSRMFARCQRFNLAQGSIETAWTLADGVETIVRREPGFDSLTLLCDETSGEYILITYWTSLEAMQAFERSADEWLLRDLMSRHLTAVPQIEVYQVHGAPARTAAATGGALVTPA